MFIIMLGKKTKTASGVLKEVKVANDLNKSNFRLSDTRADPRTGRYQTADAPTAGIGRTSRSYLPSSLSYFRRKSFVFNDIPFQLETVNTVI